MYRSELHSVLLAALRGATWTRSTKDEDNFRQVVCASLYDHISENNVEIPSTRSGHGDIRIFGRRIELKYASSDKQETLDKVVEDFELLLESKVEFSVVSVKPDVVEADNYLHRCISFPMLKQIGAPNDFGNRTAAGVTYKEIGLFLAAVFPHAPTPVTVKPTPTTKKQSTAYLSFEVCAAISQSSFLKVGNTQIHVDVVGSREDGLISFLFKRADQVDLIPQAAINPTEVAIPYAPNPLRIATHSIVDIRAKSRKLVGIPADGRLIEGGIPCFDISVP